MVDDVCKYVYEYTPESPFAMHTKLMQTAFRTNWNSCNSIEMKKCYCMTGHQKREREREKLLSMCTIRIERWDDIAGRRERKMQRCDVTQREMHQI